MSNPKALLFFVAVLPQLIDRSLPIALQLLVFEITSIVFELAVLGAYGAAAAQASRLVYRRDSQRRRAG